MIELFNSITDIMKKFSPYIVGGVIGSIIHRMRNEMTFISFLKSIVVSVFVSICVGIFFTEYLGIKNEKLLFGLTGISGAFSKLILDEFEQILKLVVVYVKLKLGIKKEHE